MSRLYATVVSVVLCGAVFSPVVQGFREKPFDDFPLSWYPMFARPRAKIETPVYVVGVDADGTRHKVGHRYWTAGGFNQGATQLLTARREGDDALDPLCTRIAARVGKERRGELATPTEIHILTGKFSRETYFRDGDHTPMSERVLTRCPVPGRPPASP